MRSTTTRITGVAAAVVGVAVLLAAPAAAAPEPAEARPATACKTLSGPAGGSLPLCKSWERRGNAYDGRWWPNGPSSLPSKSYLERSEDGHVTRSKHSGSYKNRKRVLFRVCDSLARRCNGWW